MSQTCSVSSLLLCCLLSGIADPGAFQNRCIAFTLSCDWLHTGEPSVCLNFYFFLCHNKNFFLHQSHSHVVYSPENGLILGCKTTKREKQRGCKYFTKHCTLPMELPCSFQCCGMWVEPQYPHNAGLLGPALCDDAKRVTDRQTERWREALGDQWHGKGEAYGGER